MTRRTPARTAIQHALDLLFPPRCAACQKAGHILCPTCFSGIPPLESPLCQHCGKQVGPGSICLDCSLCPVRLSGLRSVSPYQGTLRTCIHALKYEGNTRLAEPLGLLLAQAFLDYRMQADYMLSVPLHSERQKERGYNHAARHSAVWERERFWSGCLHVLKSTYSSINERRRYAIIPPICKIPDSRVWKFERLCEVHGIIMLLV